MGGRAGGLHPTLTDRQIEQILRWRVGGMEYKEIARRVGCTPDQAIHYWRTSKLYRPQFKRAIAARKREARKAPARRAKGLSASSQRRSAAAGVALGREIAQAVKEAGHAPLFKPGPLEW